MNAPPSAPEPDLSGTVLAGRYRVIRKLGAGGMGSVYLGEHTTIRKQLAIKVLAAKLAKQPELVARFLREARATSLISQHNVIEISDFGETPDGSVFFVMEYLEGEDLRALRKREKRLPWPRVRHLSLQICQALEAAHAAGVVHRDVKPDNCFRVTRGGDPDFIKVLDFGIAKIQGGEGEGKGLTRTGMIMGTAKYMAPEQAQGSSNDPRVDIYAVGIIMYELLCGRVPFSGKNMVEVLKKHIFKPPKPLRERCPDAGIPVAAEAVVLKALQKDPAHRFASMTEMIAAIEVVGTDAAPVEVVAEHIAEPELGALSFADGSSPSLSGSLSAAGLSSVAAPVASEPEPSSKLLWLGLGGIALAAGLVAVAVLGGKDDALASAESDQAAPAPAEPTKQPEPAPASAPPDREQPPDEPAPAAPASTLHFHTNVPVRVLGTNRAVYGRSDDEGGIELPRSDEAVALILAAEGYEELEIEVVPNRETKHYEYELQAIGAKRKQGKQRRRKREQPEADAPEPGSKQAPIDAPDSELMNPFD